MLERESATWCRLTWHSALGAGIPGVFLSKNAENKIGFFHMVSCLRCVKHFRFAFFLCFAAMSEEERLASSVPLELSILLLLLLEGLACEYLFFTLPLAIILQVLPVLTKGSGISACFAATVLYVVDIMPQTMTTTVVVGERNCFQILVRAVNSKSSLAAATVQLIVSSSLS